jgi:3-hydroxyisobutyrate dehydrogenase-like beta-hydroxyacid dehydrogenase
MWHRSRFRDRTRLQAGAVVVDTTTGEPEQMVALAAQLSARGVHYLDAVGGSSLRAREQDAIAIVGEMRQPLTPAAICSIPLRERSFTLD